MQVACMAEVIRVPLESGGVLAVEVDAPEAGVVKAGRAGHLAAEAAQTLESAVAALVPGATALLDKFRATKPSEVSLSFGIKLTAEAGAVIARTAGECNFAVTLRWREDSPTGG
jgi:hypothetical protein